MNRGILKDGWPSQEELKNSPGYPSEKRMRKGPVAVIECVQDIPCNPCEASCPFGAIHVGEQITQLPILSEEQCVGCGQCIAACPGLAIFCVDLSEEGSKGTIEFPYEYVPLPQKGEIVEAVDRSGTVICQAEVLQLRTSPRYDQTHIVKISIPKRWAHEIRSIKRLRKSEGL